MTIGIDQESKRFSAMSNPKSLSRRALIRGTTVAFAAAGLGALEMDSARSPLNRTAAQKTNQGCEGEVLGRGGGGQAQPDAGNDR